MRRWLAKAGIGVAVVILMVVGVRVFVAPAIIARPDSVHIVVAERLDYPTQQKTVLFDHWFAQQATPLYADLVVGGPLQGPASCPAWSERLPYYEYVLTFSRWGVTTATAVSDAIGCMYFWVQYPLGVTAGYSWFRGYHPSFWMQLHQLVNAPIPSQCAADSFCNG